MLGWILTGTAFGATLITLAWFAARKIARVEFDIDAWGDVPALPGEMAAARRESWRVEGCADEQRLRFAHSHIAHDRAVDNS